MAKKRFILIDTETHKRLRIMAGYRDCSLATLAAELIAQAWELHLQSQTKGKTNDGNKEKTVLQTQRGR